MTNWQRLIRRYADGQKICNCGDAYLTPCGHSFVLDGKCTEVHNIPVCKNGCSANQIAAKEYIALRVLAELKKSN